MSRLMTLGLLLLLLLLMGLMTVLWISPRLWDAQLNEAQTGLLVNGRWLQDADSVDEGRTIQRLVQITRREGLGTVLAKRPAEPEARDTWLGSLQVELNRIQVITRELGPISELILWEPSGGMLARAGELAGSSRSLFEEDRIQSALRESAGGSYEGRWLVAGGRLLKVFSLPVLTDRGVGAVLLAAFLFEEGRLRSRLAEGSVALDILAVGRDRYWSKPQQPDTQRALQAYFAGHPEGLDAVLDGKRSAPWLLRGEESQYLALAVPPATQGAKGLVGWVLLRNLDSLSRPIRELWLGMAVGLAMLFSVMVAGVLLFGGRLSQALQQLQREAQELVRTGGQIDFATTGPKPVQRLVECLNDWKGSLLKAPLVPTGAPTPETTRALGDGREKAGLPRSGAAVREVAVFDLPPPSGLPGINSSMADLGPTRSPALPEAASQASPLAPSASSLSRSDGLKFASRTSPLELDESNTQEISRREKIKNRFNDAAGTGETNIEPRPSDGSSGERETVVGVSLPLPTEQKLAEPRASEAHLEEDRYYKELFEQFVRAKHGVGEDVAKLNFDRFRTKLHKQEETLKEKHRCRGIRFQVTTHGKSVTLRPQLIR